MFLSTMPNVAKDGSATMLTVRGPFGGIGNAAYLLRKLEDNKSRLAEKRHSFYNIIHNKQRRCRDTVIDYTTE